MEREEFIQRATGNKILNIDHFQWKKIFFTLDKLSRKYNIEYDVNQTDISIFLKKINVVLYIHLKEINEESPPEKCFEWVIKYIGEVDKNLQHETMVTNEYYRFGEPEPTDGRVLQLYSFIAWDLINDTLPLD